MNKELVLAGGCFWGLEELVHDQEGIVDTEVGYTGGKAENPTYQDHRGHAAALKITYDSKYTTQEKILDYFFRIHDPTTKNRQGNDIGDSYRSAIFYTTEDQKAETERVIKVRS